MPFAVHLFFDAAIETAVRNAWKELADNGIAPYMHQSNNRPHLTLAIYQDLNLKECQPALQTIASALTPIPVCFEHVGVFPTVPAGVFISPTVTINLLQFHAQIQKTLQGVGTAPNAYYLPGQWTPHCTLALELDPLLTPRVLEVGLRMPWPLRGEVTEIGVIQFRPVEHLFGFSLG